jgi:hypothetical protein
VSTVKVGAYESWVTGLVAARVQPVGQLLHPNFARATVPPAPARRQVASVPHCARNTGEPPASGSTTFTSDMRKRPGSSNMMKWALRSKVMNCFDGASSFSK